MSGLSVVSCRALLVIYREVSTLDEYSCSTPEFFIESISDVDEIVSDNEALNSPCDAGPSKPFLEQLDDLPENIPSTSQVVGTFICLSHNKRKKLYNF